jgi:hypothetical protein
MNNCPEHKFNKKRLTLKLTADNNFHSDGGDEKDYENEEDDDGDDDDFD